MLGKVRQRRSEVAEWAEGEYLEEQRQVDVEGMCEAFGSLLCTGRELS